MLQFIHSPFSICNL
ncbi:hypothetical protein F383_12068 [Gossypium arboreum]|uniref:Uncharacterized protein n=1 Tax=Gossypium arboreum TaxID=29729 RepID=A0A0B0PZT5_GOSAR|nr:hypothetical protein F383_12068 [Gossypium arboreum]